MQGKKVTVYGNKLDGYTADSQICMAAMHAGILTDTRKQELLLMADEAEGNGKEFPCSKTGNCSNNGVKSQNKLAFKRFFKFVDLHSKCHFFKDQFDGRPISLKFSS